MHAFANPLSARNVAPAVVGGIGLPRYGDGDGMEMVRENPLHEVRAHRPPSPTPPPDFGRPAPLPRAPVPSLRYGLLPKKHKTYLRNALRAPPQEADLSDAPLCTRVRAVAQRLLSRGALEVVVVLATLFHTALLSFMGVAAACDPTGDAGGVPGWPPPGDSGLLGTTPGCLPACAPSWTTARVLYNAALTPLAIVFTLDFLVRCAVLGVWGEGTYCKFGVRRSSAISDKSGSAATNAPPPIFTDVIVVRLGALFDALLVIVGWLEVVGPCTSPSSRLTALRVFRLIRTLQLVWASRGMRAVVATMLSSLESLVPVALLLTLALFSFALVGTQLWRGELRGTCGWMDPQFGWQSSDSFYNPASPFANRIPCAAACLGVGDRSLCQSDQGAPCPFAYVPSLERALPQSPGFPLYVPGAAPTFYTPVANNSLNFVQLVCNSTGPNLGWGQISFDNVAYGMLQALTSITQEGWSGIMFYTWGAWGYRDVVFILFASHIVISSFILLELALAVIFEQYEAATKYEEDRPALLIHAVRQAESARRAAERAAVVALSRTPREGVGGGGGGELVSSSLDQILVPEGMGALTRMRRLESLVDIETVARALEAVEADLAQEVGAPEPPPLPRGILPGSFDDEVRTLDSKHPFMKWYEESKRAPLKPVVPSLYNQLLSPIGVAVSNWYDSTIPNVNECVQEFLEKWFADGSIAQGFFVLVVIVNALALGAESQEMPLEQHQSFDLANYFFVGAYSIEMILQLLRLGLRKYLSDPLHVFDGTILAAGIAEATITYFYAAGPGRAFSLFRTVRIARLMRILRAVPALQRLTRALLLDAVPNALPAFSLLTITIYGFALMGQQLYGDGYDQAVASGALGVGLPPGGATLVYPFNNWLNFASLNLGFILVFQVMDNENWDMAIHAHMNAFGWPAGFFFATILLVGNVFFLNVFIAIMINAIERNFEEEAARLVEELATRQPGEVRTCSARFGACSRGVNNRLLASNSSSEEVESTGALSSSSRSRGGGGGDISVVTLSSPLVATSAATPMALVQMKGSSARDVHVQITGSQITVADASTVGRGMRSELEWLAKRFKKLSASSAVAIGLEVTRKRANSADGAADVLSGASAAAHPASPNPSPSPYAYVHGLVKAVTDSSIFFWVSTIMIILSCILLALDEPNLRLCAPGASPSILYFVVGAPAPTNPPPNVYCSRVDDIRVVDFIIGIYFVVEFILVSFVRGIAPFSCSNSAVLRGIPSALPTLPPIRRAMWDWVDLATMLVSLVSLIDPGGLRYRSLKIIRALRLVAIAPQQKIVVESLLLALPRTFWPLCFLLLTMYAFALIGLQNLGGCMGVCNSYRANPNTYMTEDMCNGTFPVLADSCMLLASDALEIECRNSTVGGSAPFVWAPYPQNFDNIWNAMLTMFELLSGENWPVFMQAGMSATLEAGIYTPGQSSSSIALFYVLTQILLNMVIVEVFAGVIITTYTSARGAAQGFSLITPEQLVLTENMRTMFRAKPVRAQVPPDAVGGNCCIGRPRKCTLVGMRVDSCWQSVCCCFNSRGASCLPRLRLHIFRIVKTEEGRMSAFERVFFTLSVACVIAMSVTHYNEGSAFATAVWNLDLIFTAAFAFEAALKLLGLGVCQYFSSPTNAFDFAVAVAGIFADIAAPGGSLGMGVRITLVARIVRSTRGLSALARTLLLSSPLIINVLGVYLLDLFIFAVVGMNVFSPVRYGWLGYMDRTFVNFDSFRNAYVTMFRSSTGENFVGIMHELMTSPPYCVPDDGTCGSSPKAAVFFIAFYTITAFILINIFVAIVKIAFEDISDSDKDPRTGRFRLTEAAAKEVNTLWQEECARYPLARESMTLNREEITRLLCRLSYPLGVRGSPFDKEVSCLEGASSGSSKTIPGVDAPPSRALLFHAGRIFASLCLTVDASSRFHYQAILTALVSRVSFSSAHMSLHGSGRSLTNPFLLPRLMMRLRALRWRLHARVIVRARLAAQLLMRVYSSLLPPPEYFTLVEYGETASAMDEQRIWPGNVKSNGSPGTFEAVAGALAADLEHRGYGVSEIVDAINEQNALPPGGPALPLLKGLMYPPLISTPEGARVEPPEYWKSLTHAVRLVEMLEWEGWVWREGNWVVAAAHQDVAAVGEEPLEASEWDVAPQEEDIVSIPGAAFDGNAS